MNRIAITIVVAAGLTALGACAQVPSANIRAQTNDLAGATTGDCRTSNDVVTGVALSLADQQTGQLFLVDAAPSMPFEMVEDKNGNRAPVPVSANSGWWTDGWTGQAPDAALIQAWETGGHGTAAACWKDETSQTIALITSDEATKLIHGLRDKAGTAVYIDAPIFDAKRETALVVVAAACQGLCGRQEIMLMKKDGATWSRVGGKIFAIS